MDREVLVRRLEALGVPHAPEDIDKILPLWRGYAAALSRFPDLDPLADEPVMIFHPEVACDDD